MAYNDSRMIPLRSDNMAIDTSIKTRINLTIELDLKQKVEQLAKEDERSTNSMIIKLIKEALQARGEL